MLSVKTPAKVNLFLNVRPRQKDGYHEICSIMQAIGLWDRLDVSPNSSGTLHFECNWPSLSENPNQNLVVKAYHLFWKATNIQPMGLNIFLHKTIPTQAGLGGGSSDAAAMLQILNHLSFANLSIDALQALAAQLGADVPFFITGGLAVATGTGTNIDPLPKKLVPIYPMVIVKPRFLNIDTTFAYQQFVDKQCYKRCEPDHFLLALMQNKKSHQPICPEDYLMNDFERVILPAYPILNQLRYAMKQLGVQHPLLSGSGSAMFGFVTPTENMTQAFAVTFPEEHYDVFWTQPVENGIMQVIAES